VVIECVTSYIGRAIRYLTDNDIASAEATPDAVQEWCTHMDDLLNATVLPRWRNSWFLGDNIPGKPHAVLFHFGGAGVYRQECDASAAAGFEGFELTKT